MTISMTTTLSAVNTLNSSVGQILGSAKANREHEQHRLTNITVYTDCDYE